MVTRILAIVFAAGSLAVSGVLAIIGVSAFLHATAVFQEVAGATIFAAASALFASAGIWVRVEQNERASQNAKDVAATLGEIRDRGYDTVDRLEKLSKDGHSQSTFSRSHQ